MKYFNILLSILTTSILSSSYIDPPPKVTNLDEYKVLLKLSYLIDAVEIFSNLYKEYLTVGEFNEEFEQGNLGDINGYISYDMENLKKFTIFEKSKLLKYASPETTPSIFTRLAMIITYLFYFDHYFPETTLKLLEILKERSGETVGVLKKEMGLYDVEKGTPMKFLTDGSLLHLSPSGQVLILLDRFNKTLTDVSLFHDDKHHKLPENVKRISIGQIASKLPFLREFILSRGIVETEDWKGKTNTLFNLNRTNMNAFYLNVYLRDTVAMLLKSIGEIIGHECKQFGAFDKRRLLADNVIKDSLAIFEREDVYNHLYGNVRLDEIYIGGKLSLDRLINNGVEIIKAIPYFLNLNKKVVNTLLKEEDEELKSDREFDNPNDVFLSSKEIDNATEILGKALVSYGKIANVNNKRFCNEDAETVLVRILKQVFVSDEQAVKLAHQLFHKK